MVNITRLAAAAGLAASVALTAGLASAVTVDFGTQPGNFDPYVEDGFAFSPANLTGGDPPCPGEPACLLLNPGAAFNSTTMTTVSGLPFDLLGFSYHFIGDEEQQRGTLTVSDTNTITFLQSEFGNDPFTITATDLGGLFLGVTEITFTMTGPGSDRLDDVTAQVIPVPAGMPLLLGGLAFLGYAGLRRRRNA